MNAIQLLKNSNNCCISCRLQDVDVECVALLNDTVGCLMSCAFLDHHAEIGVILGTLAHFPVVNCYC